jgi:hypothetical protein
MAIARVAPPDDARQDLGVNLRLSDQRGQGFGVALAMRIGDRLLGVNHAPFLPR